MAKTSNVQLLMRYILLLGVALYVMACRSAAPVVVMPTEEEAPPAPTVTHWPGVDSSIALAANALADNALVAPEKQEESWAHARRALDLAQLADSLLGPVGVFAVPLAPDTSTLEQQDVATAAFNEGAAAINAYTQEPDTLTAARLLTEAAASFQAALEANPFDTDSHYWLSQVYQLQAQSLGRRGAVEEAIAVLLRLVSMHNQRHDYLALLAEAYERRASVDGGIAAAAVWERAAREAIDDTVLENAVMDSLTVFTYYARCSRAFIMALQGTQALAALDRAIPYITTAEDSLYVDGEQKWLLWDEANITTRLNFDSLLVVASTAPEEAIAGLQQLSDQVGSTIAYVAVEHERALLLFGAGRFDEAVSTMGTLWGMLKEHTGPAIPSAESVREDYGVMAYNIGLSRRAEGDMRAALGYLMQSESTGFSQAARASFEVSRLLQNDPRAALAAARRAEAVMTQLSLDEQQALLRHIVELYRRLGERENALTYVEKLRQRQ